MINDALEALKADPAVEAFNYTGDKVTSLIVDTENLYDGEQHIELSEVMYSFCMPDEIRTLGKQQAGDYSYITGTYAMIDLCDLTILERDTLELKMQTRDFLISETAALCSDLDFLRNSMGSNPAFVPFYIEQLTITDVSREEHLLSRTEDGREREGGHLTGRGHTVAVDHITLRCATMLLHRKPIGGIADAVDQPVLTVVREVGLIVTTVMRQISGLGIGISVRSICPRQRMRIDRIIRTRLVIVEVQLLQYLVVLLYLLIRDNGLAFGLF
jgi:hypothetical protein